MFDWFRLSLMNSMVGGGFQHPGAAFGAMPLVQLAQHPLGLIQQQPTQQQHEFGQKSGKIADEEEKNRCEKRDKEEERGKGGDESGVEDTDMRSEERKRRRDLSPGRSSEKRGSRRRDWGKPRVNRWGDPAQENTDRLLSLE